MTWPSSRLTTYAAAAAVKSNDLNALQDAIIAGQHGDVTLQIPPTQAYLIPGANQFQITGAAPPVAPNPLIMTSTGASAGLIIAIPLRAGQRLKSLVFARFGNGVTDTTTCTLYKTTALGVGADIASGGIVVTNAPAAWADSTINVTAPAALAAGDAIAFMLVVNAANWSIGNIRYTFDRP